jgi:hypothetical protein
MNSNLRVDLIVTEPRLVVQDSAMRRGRWLFKYSWCIVLALQLNGDTSRERMKYEYSGCRIISCLRPLSVDEDALALDKAKSRLSNQ